MMMMSVKDSPWLLEIMRYWLVNHHDTWGFSPESSRERRTLVRIRTKQDCQKLKLLELGDGNVGGAHYNTFLFSVFAVSHHGKFKKNIVTRIYVNVPVSNLTGLSWSLADGEKSTNPISCKHLWKLWTAWQHCLQIIEENPWSQEVNDRQPWWHFSFYSNANLCISWWVLDRQGDWCLFSLELTTVSLPPVS